MRARTQVIAAACVLAVGALTLWVAATQGQASVRLVDDVLAAPAAHTHGTYTLMGIPEPAQVPVTGPSGMQLVANPDFSDTTTTTQVWRLDGQLVYSTHTLRVTGDASGTQWSFRNETRHLPADPQPFLPVVAAQWSLPAQGKVFPVAAFSDPAHARVWAWYGKAPENPLQPKPSQFMGRLMSSLPDGKPLPSGALVYQVDTYTAGCSSKFLPPELQKKYSGQNLTA